MGEPSRFIAAFLRQEDDTIIAALAEIYSRIARRFQTDVERKKEKYGKKAKQAQDNYAELAVERLKPRFNKQDFLKRGYLQYLLHAYLDDSHWILMQEHTFAERACSVPLSES